MIAIVPGRDPIPRAVVHITPAHTTPDPIHVHTADPTLEAGVGAGHQVTQGLKVGHIIIAGQEEEAGHPATGILLILVLPQRKMRSELK